MVKPVSTKSPRKCHFIQMHHLSSKIDIIEGAVLEILLQSNMPPIFLYVCFSVSKMTSWQRSGFKLVSVALRVPQLYDLLIYCHSFSFPSSHVFWIRFELSFTGQSLKIMLIASFQSYEQSASNIAGFKEVPLAFSQN